MTLFTRSLWPDSVQSPYTRLMVALFVAPFLIAALLAGGAFMIAGMTENSREDVIAVTTDSALAIMALVVVFTLTFGLAGIAILWATAQRGLLIWALAGAIMGALAGTLFAFGFMGGPNGAILGIASVIGWILFVLIRRIAGIAPDPKVVRVERASLDDPDS